MNDSRATITQKAHISSMSLKPGISQEYYRASTHEIIIPKDDAIKINNRTFRAGEAFHNPPGTPIRIDSETNTEITIIEIGANSAEPKRPPPKNKQRTAPPEISVIIAAHNVENYIAATITSILEQDHNSFEIVIINDASTDNTENVIKTFAAKYNNIKLLTNNKNLGQAESRKRGLSESRGEYYLFCDADDLIASNTLKLAHEAAKNSGADCVVFGFDHLDDDSLAIYGAHTPQKVSGLPICFDPSDTIFSAGVAKLSHITTTCLLERQVHAKWMLAALHPLPYYEDIATFGAMIASSKKIHLVEHALYHYRTGREGQATNNWLAKDRGLKIISFIAAIEKTMQADYIAGASRKVMAQKFLRIMHMELHGARKAIAKKDYTQTINAFQLASQKIPAKDIIFTAPIRLALFFIALRISNNKITKFVSRRVKLK